MIIVDPPLATRSMAEAPMNWSMRNLIHPMLRGPEIIEIFEQRFWCGGEVFDKPDRHYLFFKMRQNSIVEPYGIKDVTDSISLVEFRLDLTPRGLTPVHSDVLLLMQAHQIRVFGRQGLLEPDRYILGFDEGGPWRVERKSPDIELSHLTAAFRFRTQTWSEKVGDRTRHLASAWFNPRKKP